MAHSFNATLIELFSVVTRQQIDNGRCVCVCERERERSKKDKNSQGITNDMLHKTNELWKH